MTPVRVQRQRTLGWRMPEGAVYVGRPTLYGNPWRPQDAAGWGVPPAQRQAWAAEQYDREVTAWVALGGSWAAGVELLRGKDLACWCPLDLACHADTLLRLANA